MDSIPPPRAFSNAADYLARPDVLAQRYQRAPSSQNQNDGMVIDIEPLRVDSEGTSGARANDDNETRAAAKDKSSSLTTRHSPRSTSRQARLARQSAQNLEENQTFSSGKEPATYTPDSATGEVRLKSSSELRGRIINLMV